MLTFDTDASYSQMVGGDTEHPPPKVGVGVRKTASGFVV